MKKLILGFVCLVLAGIFSCTLPQSITVKGQPGLRIPLGSPFDGLDKEDRIEYQLSPAKMKDTLSKSGNATVYNYEGPGFEQYPDLQVYAIHYTLTSQPLDFEQQVNDALSEVEGDDGPSGTIPEWLARNAAEHGDFPFYMTGKQGVRSERDNGEEIAAGDPPFLIELDDMAKMVIQVDGVDDGAFGLEIPLDDINTLGEDITEIVRVRIPSFEIDYDTEGVVDTERNTLRFVNPTKTSFIPKPEPEGDLNEKNQIEIFVKILKSCAGRVDPQPVFDWIEATIDTSEESFGGESIVKNKLDDFFEDGVSFHEAKGYLTVSGLPGDTTQEKAKITITADTLSEPLVNDQELNPTQEKLLLPSSPDEAWKPSTLPLNSLAESFDLIDALVGSEVTLSYEINIPTWVIEKENIDLNISIDTDLIILLPVRLRVTPLPGDRNYEYPDKNGKNVEWVKLNMGDTFNKFDIEKDLLSFLPDNEGEDKKTNLNLSIQYVDISLKEGSLINEIFHDDNVGLLVYAETPVGSPPCEDVLHFRKPLSKPQIRLTNIPEKFIPKFEILVSKEEGEDYGIFNVKRFTDDDDSVRFDFQVTISAGTDLELNMNR